MLYEVTIETALPDAESLRRLEARLHLDPQDRWTKLYSVQGAKTTSNRYEFTVVDRFWGHIGVKVTGKVEDGRVSGHFRRLIPELLSFILAFGLCFLFAATYISRGQVTAFLDVVIIFFFVAFVYLYRTLRFRDLIGSSIARMLDGKHE